MITIFRDKSIVAIFALVILCLLVHFHIFFEPIHLNTTSNSGVLSWLFKEYLSKLKPAIITVAYIILLLVQAIRFQLVLNNNKMFAKAAFTAAFSFIILSGLFTNAFSFSPAFIANSLVILLFNNAAKLYNNPSAKTLIFNIAFLASASVILYQPTVFVTFSLLFALAILRPFRATDWLIFIIGLATPIYLLVSGLFLFDAMPLVQKFIPQIHFKFSIVRDPWYWTNVSTIVILALAGLLVWYPNSSRMVIQIRKSWVVMLILFVLLLAGILFFNSSKYLPEVLCIVPLAAFAANFFLYPRRTVLINLVLILVIVVLVYNNMQLVPN